MQDKLDIINKNKCVKTILLSMNKVSIFRQIAINIFIDQSIFFSLFNTIGGWIEIFKEDVERHNTKRTKRTKRIFITDYNSYDLVKNSYNTLNIELHNISLIQEKLLSCFNTVDLLA